MGSTPVENPTTNYGMVFYNNEVNDKFLRILTEDHATSSYHPMLTIEYSVTGSGGTCTTANTGEWMSHGFAAQTGTFTIEFDAKPSAANMDAVIGLSNGPQQAFTGLAAIVRFNTSGTIDVRNGSAYAAATSVSYSAATSYHFKMVVNTTAHTYSVYVTPSGGSETTLASNYAFRTEQALVSSIDTWTAHVESATGNVEVCNVQTSTGDTTFPTVTITAPAASSTVSGAAVTVSATATDNVGVVGVQFLVDGETVQAEDTTSPYSIAWNSQTVQNGTHTISARARDAAGNVTTSSSVSVTVSNPTECKNATTLANWINTGFANQTTNFTVEYDATPSASPMDAAIGLSDGSETAYTGLAAITRFNPSGNIDVRNGGVYEAATTVAYAAGVKYHFRVEVNVSARTYTVYVTPDGGTQQTLASGYAFRSEQSGVTQLNNYALATETANESVTVCNFAFTAGSGDVTNPTVQMTAPAAGSTYVFNQNITVSATATDSGGIAGVQFLVDGANYGAEDTSSPYEITYNTGSSNGQHTLGARARDTSGNVATATPITINVNDTSSPAARPRIWLDGGKLQGLRSKAAANSAQWSALRSKCESYTGSVLLPPTNGQQTCSSNQICAGYYGDGYYDPLLNLALCYQIGKGLSPQDAKTNAWASKAADVLDAMRQFTNYGSNNGYGVRHFATGMAIGYDWIHEWLTANNSTLKTNIRSTIDGWLSWYSTCTLSACNRENPTSNYFAGYYAALAYSGISLQGDTVNADSYWATFLDLQRDNVGAKPGIANYYTKWHNGGGWVQGWQYGPLSVRNMVEPAIAALTGKGIDLVRDPADPYLYPINSAHYLMHFAWPSRTYLDDRGDLHNFDAAPAGEGYKCPGPSRMPVNLAESITEVLRRWPTEPPIAGKFQAFARELRNATVINHANLTTTPAKWHDFLFWDDGATEEAYANTLQRSYRATNQVAMRSDWTTNGVFGALRAIAYSDIDNQHQHQDAGSLAITRGNGGLVGSSSVDVPFLVNANWLQRCYTNTTSDVTWQDEIAADMLVATAANRTSNVFQNSTTLGQSLQIYEWQSSSPPQNKISKFEDRNEYVFTRAENLDDVYKSGANITEWSRDVVFVRPRFFIVYDRTNSGTGSPHMNWHFAPNPTAVSPDPSPGAKRWDVIDGSLFRGSMTTLLPASALISETSPFSSNKLYQLKVSGPGSGSNKWLTVFDAASTAAAVAPASTIQTMTTNGSLLTGTGAKNIVVLFSVGSAGTTMVLPTAFSIPAKDTTLVAVDLVAGTKYAVTATPNGSNLDVAINSSGTHAASENGALYVNISASGSVTDGAPNSGGPSGSSFASTMASLNPVAWWRLGETSGAAADSGSAGLSGTYNNFLSSQRGVAGAIANDSNGAILIAPGGESAACASPTSPFVQVADSDALSLTKAYDLFTRTVAAGNTWGTSDHGGSWTWETTSSGYSVDGSVAKIDQTTSAGTWMIGMQGVSRKDVDIQIRASWSVKAAGANTIPVAIIARRVDNSNYYRAEIREVAGGNLELRILKTVGGSATPLVTQSLGVAYTANDWWYLRFQLEGSSLRARAWKYEYTTSGTPALDHPVMNQPTTWTAEVTDTTYSNAGTISIRSANSGATSRPMVSFDDFRVHSLGMTIQAFMKPTTTVFGNGIEGGSTPYIHWAGKGDTSGTGESGNYEYMFRFHPESGSPAPQFPKRVQAYHFRRAGGLGTGAGFDGDNGGTEVMANTWQHVVAIYDPGDKHDANAGVTIYQNGQCIKGPRCGGTPQAETLYSFDSYEIEPRNVTAPFRIGTTSCRSFFTGALDEFAIFDRALTQAEISNLYFESQ